MTPAPRWPLVPPLALFALSWAAFTSPWALGAVTVPWDAKAHFYPQIVFLADQLARGESPFWAPGVFAGHPQIADPQSMIFAPIFLTLAALGGAPSFATVDMTVFAMLGLGGVAVMLLFRRRGWHWAGALIAALVFCFGASAAWRVQHVGQIVSLAYLPIAWLCLEIAIKRGSWAAGAAAGLVAGLMVLGRDQVALLGVYALVGVALWQLAGSRPLLGGVLQATGPLLAGAVVGIAVIALPLAMSISFGAQSNRPVIDLESAGRGSLHPVHLLTLWAADLYGSSGPMAEVWGPPSMAWNWAGIFLAQNMFVLYVGAVPLVAVLTLGWRALGAREIVGVTIGTLLLLLYALGWYTPLFELAYRVLPGVTLFRRPADATFLVGAGLGVMAGYVVHRLLTDPNGLVWRPGLWLGGVILLAGGGASLGLALWFGRAGTTALPGLVTGAVALPLAALALLVAAKALARARMAAALALVVLTATDLVVSNGPNPSTALPSIDYEVLRPDSANPVIAALKARVAADRSGIRRDRVELVGLGFHWPNATLVHGLEHTLGYNPLRIGAYAAATGAIDTIAVPDQRQFPPSFPSYRSPLADMLGLRWIVTPIPIEEIDKRLQPGALTLVDRPGGAYLYENPTALPRVALATNVRQARFADILARGFPELDYTRTVLLEGEDRAPTTVAPGSVRLAAYRATEVVVEARAPAGGGHVVLFDAWHPWWTATVDGRPAEIKRANIAFRAVAVPEGDSLVVFRFAPFEGVVAEWREKLGLTRRASP